MMQTLPEPCDEAKAQSLVLRQHILDEIQSQGGAIPFDVFMEKALYTPGLGYYCSETRKFGQAGDFVTAPELSCFFGQSVAYQCHEVLENLAGGDVLEIGPGSGRLAVDVLTHLAKWGQLPENYYLLEISASLRERQRALIAATIPELVARVQWLEQWPENFVGIVLANEVLDAMPVSRFRWFENTAWEYYVEAKQSSLAWCLKLASQPLASVCQGLKLVNDYHSEINARLKPWLAGLSQAMKKGVVLLIDYGFPAREYYHAERSQGTLNCHYRHRHHDDPFFLVGLQDITAHVDFTAVATAAFEADFQIEGYTNQAQFLVNCGLPARVEAAMHGASEKERLQYSQQVQRLTMPHEMGELFKVMALSKAMDIPLLGFATRNLLHKL